MGSRQTEEVVSWGSSTSSATRWTHGWFDRGFTCASMRVPPVPGWQTSISQLGLPPDSRIATKDRPARSDPFIGHLDDHAYFLATDGEVAVPAVNNPGAPVVLRAADLTRCGTSGGYPNNPIPSVASGGRTPPRVRLSDDATELMPLVAP